VCSSDLNNFTSPLVYTVTSNGGTAKSYTVSVAVTPVETTNTIKSFAGTEVHKNSDKKRALMTALNNTNHTIVLYDVAGTSAADFDSVRVKYALDGSFARLKFGGKTLKQDSLLDFSAALNTSTSKTVTVFSQDSANVDGTGMVDYKVYAATAPKLDSIKFLGLLPNVKGTPTDFNVAISVLKGTNVKKISTTPYVTAATGVTVTYKIGATPFIPGGEVDYTDPVKLILVVNDTNLGITYEVTYTVTVTVVP